MASGTENYRDLWPWQTAFLRVTTVLTLVGPVLAGCALYPFLGSTAFWAFPVAGFGLLVWIVYGGVGNRVTRIRHSVESLDGEIADALIVDGFLQSPGIVVLKPSEVVLLPILGQSTTIALNTISAIRECHWFNGSYYPWKTGFWITVQGKERLGFAVGNTIADRLRGRLVLAESDWQD